MSGAMLVDEFASCDFGDLRLAKRLWKLAEVLSDQPNLSIPAALRTKGDIDGCYRFFDNDKVTPEGILSSHIEATYERIRQVDYALLVQDTTEIDLTRPEQQVAGAGPMDCATRHGMFFHPTIAFDADGVALGLVGQKSWTRDELDKSPQAEKQKKRRQKPIEEKESYRWVEGLQSAQRAAEACPETICVCVGDSESDIYELFAAHAEGRKQTPNLHLLVRAGQDRNTIGGEDWAEPIRQSEKIADHCIHVRGRHAKIAGGKQSARSANRETRTAELEIRKGTVEIRRPSHCGKHLPETIKLNVVLCEERNPPPGESPIFWMLVTTLPIATEEDVQRVIASYCGRWQIEVYFRTLKSGCRIEHRRFETIDRVLNCLAFFSVVAWRLMYLCHLGRTCPELPCELMFEPSEWKSVYAVLGKEIPQDRCPTLNELIRAIARLGGFMDRPKNHPGTQTLWVGLRRCDDLSNAWNTFGPGSKNFCPP